MDGQCVGKGPRPLQMRVLHLDDSIHTFPLSVHATGKELYASMIDRLHLLESDYFDIEYVNEEGLKCWLDHEKPITRQLTLTKDFLFRFGVKFYTPFPNMLEEELTRYLFALQIKRDLFTGTLLCSENTATLLASYIVQAELGDFLEEEYTGIGYLRSLKLLRDPTEERLKRVMEYHKAHIGLTPSEADLALLDTARKVEFYGIRLHFARNHEGLGLNLAVSHLGILVYQNLIRLSTLSWANIRKLSFKRKRFMVRLQRGRSNEIEFIFDSRTECKHFWKNCIEHHTFFRCPVVERELENPQRPSRSNSTFRYTGRTQQELTEYVQEHSEKRTTFERPSSARRAYSTILSGSSYPGRKLNAASMPLRSSSVDRRGFLLNKLSDSSVTDIHRPESLQRAQSEGTNAPSEQHVEKDENEISTSSAVPTSGYATMAESTEPDGPVEETETTKEPLEEDQELDTLMWINETYRRMTGDWTGGVTHVFSQDTAQRRSKSATGSPQTSGTVSLGQLTTELDTLLRAHDPVVQPTESSADEAVSRLLLFSDLTSSGLAEPKTNVAVMPAQVTLSSSTQDTLVTSGEGTSEQMMPEVNITNIVQLMTSAHPPLQETQILQPILSTTQPDLISQADATHSVCVQRNSEPNTGRETAPTNNVIQNTLTSTHSSDQTVAAQQSSTLNLQFGLGASSSIQTLHATTDMLGDLGLRGPNALFILPTVTQYGLETNPDNRQNLSAADLSNGRPLSEATSAYTLIGTPEQHQGNGQIVSQTHQQEIIEVQSSHQYPFSMEHIVTRSTTGAHVLSAHSVPCVLQSQSKFGFALSDQTDVTPVDKFNERSSFKYEPPTSGVTTVAYPITSLAHNPRSAERPNALVTSTRMDQWSSSGSDSATGVILRPDVIQSGRGNAVALPHSRRHKPGCPHSTPPVRKEQRSSPSFQSTAYSSPIRLPSLPLDTLPARPSRQRTNMLPHTCGHSHPLSRSIPCGVHLSGMESSSSNNAPRDAYNPVYGRGGHDAGYTGGNSGMQKKTTPEAFNQTKRTVSRQELPVSQSEQNTLLMEELDTATGLLEEVPYVVVRRPKSIDVKQYQLHLRRQQQQAAALAAAGYPCHGDSPFYRTPTGYHHGSRMPVAGAEYAYAPFMTPYHPHHSHHHHALGKASMTPMNISGRSERSSASKRHSSTSPYGGVGNHERLRSMKHVPHDAICPIYPASYIQSVPEQHYEREKRKAKRRHPPKQEITSIEEESQKARSRTKETSPTRPTASEASQQRHRNRSTREIGSVGSEEVFKHATTSDKHHPDQRPLRVHPVTCEGNGVSSAVGVQSSAQVCSKMRPSREKPTSTKSRRPPPQQEDSRERDVPYPVSELFVPPASGGPRPVNRPAKIHLSTHHHPACASLLGRSRAHTSRDRHMPTKLASSESALPSVSITQAHSDRRNRITEHVPRELAETSRTPYIANGKPKILSRDSRLTDSKEVTKQRQDTQETIEKLREELRSAGFRSKENLCLKTQQTSSSEPSGKGKSLDSIWPATTVPKSFLESPVSKVRLEGKDEEFPKRPSEEPAAAIFVRPVHTVETTATKSTTHGTEELEVPVGGPPRNPIYLDSDTDSNEDIVHGKPNMGQTSQKGEAQVHTVSEKPAPVCPVLSHEESQYESETRDMGASVLEKQDIRPDHSPVSHSPSLPLSLVPSERHDEDGTDMSTSILSSTHSPSTSYCSQCQPDHNHESSSPSSPHSYCHYYRRGCNHHSCHLKGHRSCASSRNIHRCHLCSTHCHRRRSYHRRAHHADPYHWMRPHSERPHYHHHRHYHKHPPEAGSHMSSNSLGDRRPKHHTLSSSERTDSSHAHSCSDSSVSAELLSYYEGERHNWDFSSVRPKRIQSVIERLLAQERRLCIELARHRALADELQQEKLKLLDKEHERETEKSGPRGTKSRVKSKESQPTMEPSTSRVSKSPTKPMVAKASDSIERLSSRKNGHAGEKKKPIHTNTKPRHYRIHPASIGIRPIKAKHTSAMKNGGMNEKHKKVDTSKQEIEALSDLHVEEDLIIENAVALSSPEPDGEDTHKEPAKEDEKLGPVSESTKTPELVVESSELKVIVEAAVCEEDEKETDAADLVLNSTAEIYTFLASSCEPSSARSVEKSAELSAVLQESTPPHAAPGETSVVGVEMHIEGAGVNGKSSTAQQEVSNNQLSSVNHLSGLDLSTEASDGEYDGSHAINLLSEIIENALASYTTEHSDTSNTDGSTRGSSTCDDAQTSEASVDTVKLVHTSRMNSPSDSTTSASEGSEEIEPFPPPPPPELLSHLHSCPNGSTTHSHHIFSSELDEVIEEESGTTEAEWDTENAQTRDQVELETTIHKELAEHVTADAVVQDELQPIQELDAEVEEEMCRESNAIFMVPQAPSETENDQAQSAVHEVMTSEIHNLLVEDNQLLRQSEEKRPEVKDVSLVSSENTEEAVNRGLDQEYTERRIDAESSDLDKEMPEPEEIV